MILDALTEITIMGVLDRGIPNKECIALRIERHLNIAQYGLVLGTTIEGTAMAVPIRDSFFWFGEALLAHGDWIFIYTGSGQNTQTRSIDNTYTNYTLYWNRPYTALYNSNTVPMIFRVGAVQVHQTPPALPQK